jgi:hypothetical protein
MTKSPQTPRKRIGLPPRQDEKQNDDSITFSAKAANPLSFLRILPEDVKKRCIGAAVCGTGISGRGNGGTAGKTSAFITDVRPS